MADNDALKEALKDLREQVAKQVEEEEVENEEEVVEEKEIEEEKPEEPAEEEKPKEEKKPEVEEEKSEEKKPEEEAPDSAAFQRLRREAAAAKKRADDAEAKLRAQDDVPEEKEDAAASVPLVPELEEVLEERRFRKAEREFQTMEAKVKRGLANYDEIAGEYTLALAQSIRLQNPRMGNDEIVEKTKRAILMKAANYMAEGYDPVEEIYHEAKDLGFSGASLKKMRESSEKPEEQEIRPDMKKVAANRAKSSGMAGASGKSEGQMTAKAASELTVAEWSKLPAAEKKRLMYG